MHAYFRDLLAVGAALLVVTAIDTAHAAGSSGIRTMDRFVHRADQGVMVYAKKFGGPAAWDNPDGCDVDRRVVLLPNPDNSPETYDQQLETLRTAYFATKRVSFTLDGCHTFPDGVSVPKIRLISVYD